jgi:hypothetical protein
MFQTKPLYGALPHPPPTAVGGTLWHAPSVGVRWLCALPVLLQDAAASRCNNICTKHPEEMTAGLRNHRHMLGLPPDTSLLSVWHVLTKLRMCRGRNETNPQRGQTAKRSVGKGCSVSAGV